MQEHLIPQDITGYRFHLIGELDLKQFAEVGIGGILAVIIYISNLPPIIQWPLMMFFVAGGLLAAFIPIHDQPLSHWLRIFFKNIMAPTKFYWKKSGALPKYLSYELPHEYANLVSSDFEINYRPARKIRAKDFFTSIDSHTQEEDPLEIFQPNNIQAVMENFNQVQVEKVEAKKQIIRPSIKTTETVRTRQLSTLNDEEVMAFLDNSSLFAPKNATTITNVDANNANDAIESTTTAPLPQNPEPAQQNLSQINNNEAISPTPDTVVEINPPLETSPSTPTTVFNEPTMTTEIVSPVTIPNQEAIAPQSTDGFTTQQTTTEVPTTNLAWPSTNTTQIPETQANAFVAPNTTQTNQDAFVSDENQGTRLLQTDFIATDVQPGAQPNILSGIVTDSSDQPLAQAVVSVRDTHNNLKSLAKTDDSGHFKTPQPLSSGHYVVSAQKDSLIFPEYSVMTNDTSTPTLTIKAQT
ncbi:MAG: carboxypeptidase regulatory-like domain-containing protein [Pseudomonadales bacterium]|jgi:hypothetical protein|nr:carboxypeptidase regulatory-like domain-containing protein [Pseudomonadales bacterium]